MVCGLERHAPEIGSRIVAAMWQPAMPALEEAHCGTQGRRRQPLMKSGAILGIRSGCVYSGFEDYS